MVRFAILGAGSIARTMADTVNGMKGEIEPYAIAARDKDRAEAFRQQYGFTVSYGSYEEMLADPNVSYGSYEEMLADPKVDLVYIAVPHSHHHRWTLAALSSPLAPSPVDARSAERWKERPV